MFYTVTTLKAERCVVEANSTEDVRKALGNVEPVGKVIIIAALGPFWGAPSTIISILPSSQEDKAEAAASGYKFDE